MSTREVFSGAMRTNGKIATLRREPTLARAGEPDLEKLARLISAYAPHDGSFELRIPGVHASRLSRANRECFYNLRVPSLCLIAARSEERHFGAGALSILKSNQMRGTHAR